jgi:translation initiation factor IF-2
MNITELARILKITPQELHDYLPKFGFDIGQKAIKIDKSTANKIIKEWPRLRRRIEMEKQDEREKREQDNNNSATTKKKEIKIPRFITIRELSALSALPVSKILAQLMKNGIFASLNEKIDYDTAWLIGADLGLDIKLDESGEETETAGKDTRLKDIINQQELCDLKSKPPVIVVMGHVDHGKTKLLDSIRHTNVVAGEAGGITQHVGAYQVERNGKKITFIDTPGHEAFTAMRSRGAKIADIAILVVAADDGVKPQTTEAYKIIQKAGLPLIVAINKIDKTDANIEKTKQELSNQLNLLPEDWGGKTICVPVSALDGTNIDNLLDMILLVADVEHDKIVANPDGPTAGTVIEADIDKGSGPVATIIIQNGTIRVGDNLICEGIDYGKVRALYDYTFKTINSAGPAVPVKIIGLKLSPQVGDVLEVGVGKKIKIKKIKILDKPGFLAQKTENEEGTGKKLNVIIKSDVLGSAEAIEESLEKISGRNVKVKIIHKGLGNITEGDVKRAEASEAIILAFNVKALSNIEELARNSKVEIKTYSIIYDLINNIKERMKSLAGIETKIIYTGSLKVLAIFRTEAKRQVVGGKILDGRIEKNTTIELFKDSELCGLGKIGNLQSGKQDVSACQADEECGLEYIGKPDVAVGDILKFYKEEKIIVEI